MAEKTKKKKRKSTPKAEIRSEEAAAKPSSDEVDGFVAGANRFGERLRPHAAKITVLIVLVIAGGLGYAGYKWNVARKAMKATTAFAEAMNASHRTVEPPSEEPDPSTTDPSTDLDADDEPKPFPSREARAEAILASLSGAESIAAPAALLRADALMDLKKFDEASRAYAEAADALAPEAATQARAGIAYAYEAKAEATEDAAAREQAYKRATEAFKAMQPAADGIRHDEALFHQARLHAIVGKRDEAIALYQKILVDHSETLFKTQIETRLEMLGAE